MQQMQAATSRQFIQTQAALRNASYLKYDGENVKMQILCHQHSFTSAHKDG